MITLENKRVHDYIVDKDKLVEQGRAKSREIEILESKLRIFETKEKRITSKVIPPKELTDKGDMIVKQVTGLNEDLEKIALKINKSKLDAIPEDLKKEHLELLKKKEVLERERNKIALKVQKIRDRLIPIIQKEVKPLLDEYDDIETAKTKGGKVIIETFNRLAEWKKGFHNN